MSAGAEHPSVRTLGGMTMNFEKIVCNCMNVTSGQIKEAVENGASTLEEIQQITGASTVCGACLDDVERLVNYFVAQRDKAGE